MNAVIRTGGKQYRVTTGQIVRVERLPETVGERVEMKDVLMLSGESGVKLAPGDAKVVCQVLRHGRTRKVLGLKMKRRKDYRRLIGHRQDYTQIRVEKIIG